MATPRPGEGPRRTGPWSFLALALAAVLVYLPTVLHAGFVNFDDNLFFRHPDNAAFAGAGVAGLLDPTRTIANVYLPVSHLSLWLDLQLLPTLGTGWVHLHSVLVHLLAAFALCRWFQYMGLRPFGATAGALLFLVHPALVESVAWVSSRKDVLSGLFVFAALVAVARHTRGGGLPAGAAALVCGLLALYAKATAVVLPPLALLTWWRVRQPGTGRRGLVPVAGLFALAAVAGLHHAWLAAAEGTLAGASALDRLVQVPGAFAHYLVTVLWPMDLNVLHPEVKTFEALRAALPWAVGVLGVLVLLAATVFARGRLRLVGCGVAGFLIALLPFNTAFPASDVPVADRYLYLALPCLVMAVVAVPRVGPVLAAAAALVCVPLSWDRAGDFEDSAALWEASLEEDPDNAVALINLASSHLRQWPEDLGGPQELLERAARVARYPVHALDAHERLRVLAFAEGRFEASAGHALAAVRAAEQVVERRGGAQAEARLLRARLDAFRPLRLAGREEEAGELLRLAEAASPDRPAVLAFRAMLELGGTIDSGDDPGERWPRARELLERALQADPDHFESHLVWANWARLRGEALEALRHYRRAVRARPGDAQGYVDMAQFHMAEGQYDEARRIAAEAFYQRGLRDPALLQTYAHALIGMGEWRRARTALEDYLDLRPRDVDAHRALAHVLMTEAVTGLYQLEPDVLVGLVKRAREHDPRVKKADLVLGKVALDARRFGDAVVLLRKAVEELPGSVEARRLLARAHRDRGWELQHEGARAAAMDHWRAALDLALPSEDVEVLRTMVGAEARRQERAGSEAAVRGEHEEALRHLRRAVELDPDPETAARTLARLLYTAGEGLEEVAALGEGRGGELRLLRLLALRELGREEEAAAVEEEILGEILGESLGVGAAEEVRAAWRACRDALVAGWRHRRAGETDRALDAWRRALDVAPEGAELPGVRAAIRAEWDRLDRLGEQALKEQRWADAEGHLRRARRLLPDRTGTAYLLGLALFQREDPDLEGAVEALAEAAAGQRARDGDASLPVLYQVMALLRLGRRAEAERIGRELLADPGPARDDVLDRLRELIAGG